VHGWLLSAANKLRSTGCSEAEVARLLKDRMTRPPSPANEVETAVRKAYSSAWRPSFHRGPVPIGQISFDPAKLKAAAARIVPPSSWRHWIWERSPRRPEAMKSLSFLKDIFLPGEKAACFDELESATPSCIVTITDAMDCRAPHLLQAGGRFGKGIWFLCNPVDGKWHPNPRENGKQSCRSEESITAFRYAVLEADQAPADHWLSFIVQLPIKTTAIYTSGKRSIHTLIRLDAASKEHWDSIVTPLKRGFKVMGADASALSAVRLSRLPQCPRPEASSFQRLLYLHPDPPLCPLVEMPVLFSRAWTLARWRRDHPRWNSAMEAFS
jgi:hypothetical protein